MAAGNYTTEGFISSVRRRAYIQPTDDGTTFPLDTDVLALANEEIVSFLVPWILKAREGHFVTNTTIPLVSNQNQYMLPSRAVADIISTVILVDSNGNPVFPGLVEMDPEEAIQYPYSTQMYGQPTKYFYQGNTFTLVPTPSDASLSLKVYYPQRPNQLVKTTAVGTITALAYSNGSLTVSYTGGSTAGFAANGYVEFVHSQPGFEVIPAGTTGQITSTGAGSLVIAATAAPTNVAVGDYVVPTDTANVLTGIPADVFGLFAQWLAVVISDLRRDAKAFASAMAVFERTEKTTRASYLGKRGQLEHRKLSSVMNRVWGRRPVYWVK